MSQWASVRCWGQPVPLGTDEIGRNILTRMNYASRIILAASVMSAVGALLIGVPLGLLAGWFGRFADAVVMRAMDSMLSIRQACGRVTPATPRRQPYQEDNA